MNINYKIEGNISFYDELFKSLDDDSDKEEDNICQISSLPLETNFIKLECQHKFNYLPLYKEICRQKFDFKTYDLHLLSRDEQHKIKNTNLDYFIKCPYCRNIQFTILPYYEDLGLEKKYGVNSLDPNLPSRSNQIIHFPYGHENYTFCLYGVVFKKGICCEKMIDSSKENCVKNCTSKYCAQIPNTDIQYCKYHYVKGLKAYKINEKNKLIEEKKKQKENLLKEKQNKLENINKERESKGLPPLKRIVKKKNSENFIISEQEISYFNPEQNTIQPLLCSAILKSGLNKGKPCGNKLINLYGLCKRHCKN